MRRFFFVFFPCLILLVSLFSLSASAEVPLRIVVGGDHENPPYEFLKDGKATGFNVELMQAVADAAGLEVEIRLGPWDVVRKELEQGKIDALAGMYYSEERSRLVDFSVPHTLVSAGLFVRKDSPIRSMDDIKGREVIVQKGDVIDDYLKEKGITSSIIEVTDPADVLRLLASGKHDCALMPSRFQGEYLKQALGISNLRVMAANLPQLRYCFAVRNGNSALRFRLDEGMNILKVNGKYKEIYNRWFGVYEKRDLWKTRRYFVWALGIIGGLLAGSFIWSWILRRQVRIRTAELREREESLRFTQYAIDRTVDQAFWMTEGGRIFYVNDAACRSLGYTREELLTLAIPDIDPIFQEERFAEHWRDIREKGYATFETLHRAKDGRVYPVEIRANYVVFDGREYNCAFATDISERKRAESELRESEEKFRVLAETSPAAICVYQDDDLAYLNTAMTRLTGYSEHELLNMKFWEWIHEDYRGAARERSRAIQRGEPVPSRYEIKILTKEGAEKWLLISTGRIDYRGRESGIVTMFDITDLKRMDEELRHAYDDLERQVLERTAELRRAKELLEEEISVRNRTERVIMARLRLLELAATHSQDELLEATIDEAESLTGSSIGFFHFLEADEETLSLKSWSTRTKAEFCRGGGRWVHYDFSATGIPAECVRERRPIIRNDCSSLSLNGGNSTTHPGLSRELVLPVFRGDNIAAVIGVGNKPDDYTPEDVEMVSFLADLAWEITERKQAEEALRLSQFCIDKAGIAIFQSDGTGTIYSVNEHACKSLGYSKEELCALSIYDIDPDITPERMLELKEILDEHGSVTHHSTHRRRDGTTFPVEITANSIDFFGKSYGISFVTDITNRKQAEESLRESESRVRRKLESILDPEGDIGELELADIIDATGLQALMDDLYRNTGLKMSIIDLKGRVLVDVGWQDICRNFHRVHPECRERCRESDTLLTEGVPPGEFRTYRCRNNMWHLVTPIMVGVRHMGNLFMGQFFFENEEIDYGLFRAQARECGFPEEEYIAALEAVPRHSEEYVNNGKAFFLRLVDMLSKLSYGNIKLARLLAERDRLTETLRQANMVVENSPVVLFRCSAAPGWPVELVSKNVIQFGYAPEEFLSGQLTYSSIVYSQDLAKIIAETEEFSATGEGQLIQEYRIVTREGDVRWIIDETVCKRNGAGEITHYEGVIIDVTERRKAEEELIVQQMLLRELNMTLEERVMSEVVKNREKDIMLIQQNRQAALGEILDHVAHQWKQPLNAISLITYLLKDDSSLTMEKINDTVDKIIAQVEHMTQTLNVFRDFYRPDKEKSVFRVKEAVDRAISFTMQALRFESVTVEVETDPKLEAIGYPKEFAQVIINLVTNARDVFRERKVESPRLVIKAFAEKDRTVVTVADNGGGISDTVIASIFDMNFTTKESSGGTGIGLYMSKNIIERRMGGTLKAANIDGGAQFSISLATGEPGGN